MHNAYAVHTDAHESVCSHNNSRSRRKLGLRARVVVPLTLEVNDALAIWVHLLHDGSHLSLCSSTSFRAGCEGAGVIGVQSADSLGGVFMRCRTPRAPVGDLPRARMTVPSSLVVIQPSPSCVCVCVFAREALTAPLMELRYTTHTKAGCYIYSSLDTHLVKQGEGLCVRACVCA